MVDTTKGIATVAGQEKTPRASAPLSCGDFFDEHMVRQYQRQSQTWTRLRPGAGNYAYPGDDRLEQPEQDGREQSAHNRHQRVERGSRPAADQSSRIHAH